MATATLVFYTGFNMGRAPSITGNLARRYVNVANAAAVTTTNPRTGAYALLLTGASTLTNIELTSGGLLAGGTAVVASFGLMFPSALPSNSPDFCCISTSGNDAFMFYQATGTKLGVAWSGGSTFDGPVVVADVWYWIDMLVDAAANPHTLSWRVNEAAQTGTTTAAAAGSIVSWTLGRVDAVSGTYEFDDVRVGTTSSEYPLGQGKVALLLPDTGATATEIGTANSICRFTSNGGALDTTFSSADILAAISEVPPVISAAATGLYQRTSGTGNAINIPFTSYQLQAGEEIEAVVVRVLGWAASATANNLELRAFDGTNETTLITREDPNFDASTTAPAWWCAPYTPSGGWDQAKLDALAIRIGYSNDVSPVPGCHAIYVEVSIKQNPVAPTTVAAVASIPTPSVTTGGGSPAPSTVAAVTTIPTPSVVAESTTAPTTVAAVASIPTPTAVTSSTASPTTVAATASIPAPTATTGTTPAPSTVAAVASIPAPTVAAGATAAPTTVAGVASIPTPTATAGAEASPTTVAATATIPAPAVTAATTATPTTVAGAASIPAPTLATSSVIGATTVQASATVPAPDLATSSTTTPATVAATTSIPTPAAAASSTAQPNVVTVTSSIPTPTITAGATAGPATVTATTSIPTPTATAASTATAATVTAVASIPTPTATSSATPQPATVAAAVSIPTPTVETGGDVSIVMAEFVNPAGDPVPQGDVTITLIAGTPTTPGYTMDGTVGGDWTTVTDDNGQWSVALPGNSTYEPVNTYYQVVLTDPSTRRRYVSAFVVPATGGPYNLTELLITPTPPAALGITAVTIAADGIVAGVRPGINLIAGAGIVLTAVDNPANSRVDITISLA